jgi:hypothetical protein
MATWLEMEARIKAADALAQEARKVLLNFEPDCDADHLPLGEALMEYEKAAKACTPQN